jgi:hypothetical protein
MYITEDCYQYKGSLRLFNPTEKEIEAKMCDLFESIVTDDEHDDMWKLFGPVWVEDISVLKADCCENMSRR